MNINIPTNTYVQPTEPREEVVQAVCDILLKDFLDKRPLRICNNDGLYLGISKADGKVISLSYESKESDITARKRVFGCEMKCAFDALQKAKYVIYSSYNAYERLSFYYISVKPYCDNKKGEHTEFNTFID